MKNKGFTLIELLAVIIILGVIMLIAIPSVTRYINDSRKETYIDTAKQIVKGAIPMVNGGESLMSMIQIQLTIFQHHVFQQKMLCLVLSVSLNKHM